MTMVVDSVIVSGGTCGSHSAGVPLSNHIIPLTPVSSISFNQNFITPFKTIRRRS